MRRITEVKGARGAGVATPTTPAATLVCVLDWGLGHATRSLALAEQLRVRGDKIHWASSGRARAVLLAALPTGTTVHELPPYDVRYPTKSMPFNVALQLPKWLRTMWRERRRTAELVRELGIDRVVSDSRFGCFVPGVSSVMLTHQLHPITHSRPVSALYRWWLRRSFTGFWVPDFADRRLSGKLSDDNGYHGVEYIGPLSRLEAVAGGKAYDYLALLSGPEPMRSRLEARLRAWLPGQPGEHLIVRGVPSVRAAETVGNVTVLDYADADFLGAHLPLARRIICRSGYSTLMDLAALAVPGKVCLVPTPGQTEQEFLARAQVRGGDAEAVWGAGELIPSGEGS